jgi:hypothetical protein
MKKLLLLLFIAAAIAAQAQHILPEYYQKQYGFEIQPANLYLDADKNLCELNEVLNINIRMTIADKENAVPYIFNYKFWDPFDAPWKVGDFKIVSGGGKIVLTDGNTAQLQMPASMPKEKSVTVQVTLNPVAKGYQQVQLFTTIYLEDNDNVFYFNCPYLGINHEKYVIKNNGGAFVKPDAAVKTATDKKIAAAQQKAQEYAIKAAAADFTATQHGFNLASLTSNAKAIYAKETDVTAILINDTKVEMVNGILSGSTRIYAINISVPGKTTGNFIIKSKFSISATISLPGNGIACSCVDDPEEKKRRQEANEPDPTCMGGTITITKYDDKNKIIEGRLDAHLESTDPTTGKVFYSTLIGKFKAPIAN